MDPERQVRGRSREIGIRTALGAPTSDVLVVVKGMTPALIGIGAGGVAALALVALLASVVPAYRASRGDPLTVLRAG